MLKIITIFVVPLCFGFLNGCCSIKHFRYVRAAQENIIGKTVTLTPDELIIEETLKKATALPVTAKYFGQFFKSAVLAIDGYDSLAFTIVIKDEKADLVRGVMTNLVSDMTIHLNTQNCQNILAILEDGVITPEEEYRIFCVTFLPSYKATLSKDPLYNPYIAKRLDLPGFMHVVLKNEQGFTYQNSKQPLGITIANVNGQWLAFKGLEGNPDIRMEVTVEQAKAFTRIIFDGITKAQDSKEAGLKLIDDIKTFMSSVTVYKRDK